MRCLDEVIKEHVLKVLENTKNQSEAAKILKISVRTIRNHLRRWGIMAKEKPIMKNLSSKERDYFENRSRP